MSIPSDSASPPRADRRRVWFLYLAVVLAVLAPLILRLATFGGKPELLLRVTRGATFDPKLSDLDTYKVAMIYKNAQLTILYTCYAALAVFFYQYALVVVRICRVSMVTSLIALELIVLLWMVHGGLASMGIPGLFWNVDPGTELRAGAGTTLFIYWMLYLIFGRNFDANRRRSRRLIWYGLKPVIDQSGLPASLGLSTDDVRTGVGQLRWFLGSLSVPLLLDLVLLAVLPAARPGDVDRLVAWPWLLGMVIGVSIVITIVWTRGPTRIYVLWQQFISGRLDVKPLVNLAPYKLDANANVKNILLLVGSGFVITWIPIRGFWIWLFPPAFSICVLLGLIATFTVWAATWEPRVRVAAALLILGLMTCSGGLDYEVELKDLKGWYPSALDQIRHQFDVPETSLPTYAKIKSLRDYQKRVASNDADASEQARKKRETVLDLWAHRVKSQRSTPGKPILVVVTTSGGALRAAHWTESVLRHLETQIPGFSSHIRLITGASGGMLGAANHVSLMVEGQLNQPAGTQNLLSNDYLTPIAWQIAFRDFVPNAFCPFATYNRGDALEDAWRSSRPGLKRTFREFKVKEEEGEIPSIVFSPMLVEDGRRLLIGNPPLADLAGNPGDVLIRDDRARLRQNFLDQLPKDAPPKEPDDHDLEFPDLASVSAVELFEVLGEECRDRLSLASAVRMSATFPFVTSAATVPTDPPRHVVDAGYYDNYGVNLASGWISSHRDWLRDHVSGVLVVQIRAFRNEKRLKLLDEDIEAPVKPPEYQTRLSRWSENAEAVVRFFPETVSLFSNGLRSWLIPVMGIARARESSMFFRNDEQLIALQQTLLELTNDDGFFRSVIFTCDTIHVGQEYQNVETLNWYIDPSESDQIWHNMERLDPVKQTGRERNHLRLQSLIEWWNLRQGLKPAANGSGATP